MAGESFDIHPLLVGIYSLRYFSGPYYYSFHVMLITIYLTGFCEAKRGLELLWYKNVKNINQLNNFAAWKSVKAYGICLSHDLAMP